MRRWLLILLLTSLVGCGAAEPPHILSVEVEPVWEGVATVEEYPERVVVKLSLENPSSAVKLLSGKVRIGYGGRWVAMLTLAEKVKIPARGSATVELPFRLNVQRTAQTLQLRSALKQGNTEGVEVAWQVAVRSRMMYFEQEQQAIALEQLAGKNLEQIKSLLADIFEE